MVAPVLRHLSYAKLVLRSHRSQACCIASQDCSWKTETVLAKSQIEKVSYAGWANCYRLFNADIELIVTSDVGPRIIRCAFIGGQNLFAELPAQAGNTDEPWWMLRGGHRLWISPEVQPDTYALDNSALTVSQNQGFLTLLQPVEPETSLQKEISIRLDDSGEILVHHRIENRGPKARLCAPWALTVMAPGGLAITAFPSRCVEGHPLQPTNPLVMWSYTDFADPRWTFTSKYLALRQDPTRSSPQKAGIFNEHSLSSYLLGTDLFVKRAKANSIDPYPDFHSSVELFTNADFLELETLGPLLELKPDTSVTHVERWSLHRDVTLAACTEREIDKLLLPLLDGS